MGEKFGRDNIWESHLATELWTTQMEVRAVLDEQQISLKKVLEFKVGDTLMLNTSADDPIELRAGTVSLTTGQMGRRNHHISVRCNGPLTATARRIVQEPA
jgi:flagellar motor switch protein FliM